MPVPPLALELSSVSARSSAGTGILDVSLRVRRGSLYVVLGESLSGASEVLAVLGGYLPLSAGVMSVYGRPTSFAGHAGAEELGIAVIRGEPNIVPQMTVAENVFLGREKSARGFINFKRLFAEAAGLLARLGVRVNVTAPAAELSRGERRAVEYARTVVTGRSVLLIEEPFAGLDARELGVVLGCLGALVREGMTVVVSTHRVDLVRQLAAAVGGARGGVVGGAVGGARGGADGVVGETAGVDGAGDDAVDVTVLSRGRAVDALSFPAGSIADGPESRDLIDRLVTQMASNVHVPRRQGRGQGPGRESIEPGPVVFDVVDWSVAHLSNPDLLVVRRVNLEARRGEIVGVAGLEGSGVSELLQSLFGRSYGSGFGGELRMHGHPVDPQNAPDAIALGIGLSTAANLRYDLGLLGGIPSRVTPSALGRLARLGLVDRTRNYAGSGPILGMGGISGLVGPRGGGQRGATASTADADRHRDTIEHWLALSPESRPAVVLLDHPLRGTTVPEALALRALIVELAAGGAAVVLASADLAELLGIADRIYALAEGRITAEFDALRATPGQLLRALVAG